MVVEIARCQRERPAGPALGRKYRSTRASPRMRRWEDEIADAGAMLMRALPETARALGWMA